MNNSFKIGNVLQIPVYLHWTFAAALAAALLSGGADRLLYAIAAFTFVLIHEYAHALMARRYGLPTTDITLHYFGGAAAIKLQDATPKQEANVALAGPAINFVIAAALIGLAFLIAPMVTPSVLEAMYKLIFLNTIIAVFNLIPIFPLDGGRILRSALQVYKNKSWATKASLDIGVVFSSLLLIVSIAFLHSLILLAAILFVVSLILRKSPSDSEMI